MVKEAVVSRAGLAGQRRGPRERAPGQVTEDLLSEWTELGAFVSNQRVLSEGGYAWVTVRGAEFDNVMLVTNLRHYGNHYGEIVMELRIRDSLPRRSKVTGFFREHQQSLRKVDPGNATFDSGAKIVITIREQKRAVATRRHTIRKVKRAEPESASTPPQTN